MNHLAVIAGLVLLYLMVSRISFMIAERNRYRYRLVNNLQELVVEVFRVSLWILAIIVGLTA